MLARESEIHFDGQSLLATNTAAREGGEYDLTPTVFERQ